MNGLDQWKKSRSCQKFSSLLRELPKALALNAKSRSRLAQREHHCDCCLTTRRKTQAFFLSDKVGLPEGWDAIRTRDTNFDGMVCLFHMSTGASRTQEQRCGLKRVECCHSSSSPNFELTPCRPPLCQSAQPRRGVRRTPGCSPESHEGSNTILLL